MKTRIFAGLATGILLVGAAGLVQAAPVQWATGNGNWYQVVSGTDMTWEEARDSAKVLTFFDGSKTLDGHLVTLTSAAENTFVWGNVVQDGQRSLNYWLGGYQYGVAPDPAVQTKEDEIANSDEANYWHWVTGEAWSYTDWSLATNQAPEPNENYWSWDNERYLNYYKDDGSGAWNDLGNEMASTDSLAPVDNRHSEGVSGVTCFIVEYEPSQVPIPTTIFLFGSGLVGLAGMRSRKRKK